MRPVVYIPLTIVLGIIILLGVLSSIQSTRKQAHSTSMMHASFSRKDKKAGGTYVAYHSLKDLFMLQEPRVVTRSFASTIENDERLWGAGSVYILVAGYLYTTPKDADAMLKFVSNGNQLFLSVVLPDTILAKELGFEVADAGSFETDRAKPVQHYTDSLMPYDSVFLFGGRAASTYFGKLDSTTTTVLGTNVRHLPNFIKIKYGLGQVFISLNPYTLTNYFLLEKEHVKSLERQTAYLMQAPAALYWDDYYNKLRSSPRRDFSEWQVLMRYPAMRWALGLALALMLLYAAFESKRRQRIIPDKPVLVNNSLEFVDTLGQLYYQQHNNANLAQKMIAHLLEYIRNRYYINTTHLNQTFVETLSRKAARPETEISALVRQIHNIHLSEQVSDKALQELYKDIQQFYLNTK